MIGQCSCGNRAFFQHTLVVFSDDSVGVMLDAEGRSKLYAADVRKIYVCANCAARWVWNAAQNAWVHP